MPNLTLVREAKPPGEYFPPEVRDLVELVRERAALRPVVLTFLKWVQVHDSPSHRHQAFDLLCVQHGVGHDLDAETLDRAFQLLTKVYNLGAKDYDSRGRVVEYIAHQALSRDEGRRTVIQSALRWQDGGRTTRVLPYNSNFDVAVLGENVFIGYECKTTLADFLSPGQDGLSPRSARKLQFMVESRSWIQAHGRLAHVALVSLEMALPVFIRVLQDQGFASITLLGLRHIQQMIG